MIEKLNTQSDDENLFQSKTNMNHLDCNDTKVCHFREKVSETTEHSILGIIKFSLVRLTNNWAYISIKN